MGKLAIVPNVGTLVRPMTKAQYQSGVVPEAVSTLFAFRSDHAIADERVERTGVHRLGRTHVGQHDHGAKSERPHTDDHIDLGCTAFHRRADNAAARDRECGNFAGRSFESSRFRRRHRRERTLRGSTRSTRLDRRIFRRTTSRRRATLPTSRCRRMRRCNRFRK